MGAFDNDAFAVTAFAETAFSMDAGTPPPAPAAGGYRVRRRSNGGQ